jgi:hypothetical protein
MSEDTTTTTETTEAETTAEQEEQRVPYERFQQANKKAKDAAERAKALEKDLADLRAQFEEREQAGLPELERLKKDMERAQKRADEAEQRAADADARVQRTQRERWITAAAKDFADPADAVAFLNLDEIEDEKDAERAVKRLAGQKKHLLKAEEPKLPGKVLKGGRPATEEGADDDPMVQVLSEGLRQFASRD